MPTAVQPHPLGRIRNHDPRSRAYPAPRSAAPLRPVAHRVYGRVLDQGRIGMCVLAAAAGALNTAGLHRAGERTYTAADAEPWYEATTRIDTYPGQYPPDDTGTDATAAAKYLRSRGLIAAWSHVFTGAAGVRAALQLGPVLLGVTWHEGMWETDPEGYIHVTGAAVGGHETFLRADPCRGYVVGRNSWGPTWGRGGDYRLSYPNLDALLADGGDATVFHRTTT